ncbi:hypothetical protein Nepgr_006044 [Nepenthes gracilis]|uniref:Cytochrome P450 n=1 Tax=Nepenthes gracilis TaxID=150966 RepID=A0AAD3S4T6_NEPGR|nr:hypothetical protein Nepgr_006044 [Nepenthes gracilis]
MDPFLLSLYLSSTLSILLLLHLLLSTCRRKLRLPPGNYGLPFIGETLQLISAYKSENPEPFIDERVRRFGPIFTTHVFGEPTVFSADPETNGFILQNEGKLFESSYPSSISNLLGKHSLLLMKGNLHKRMHSLTVSFANSSIIRDHLLLDIDRLVRLNLDSWTGHVFLMEEAKKITFALTMKQLMSYDPCDWTERLRKQYLLVVDGFFTIPFPFFSTTYTRAIKARGTVVEALRLVVRERREESERGERKNDMLGALFDEGRSGSGGSGFSDEEIVDFVVALLVAGYETTSIIMTLAVKFLTETPRALAQLKEEQEEIRAKKGVASETLTWSDYKSMHFTQCVVNETLRLANIIEAYLGAPCRTCMSEVTQFRRDGKWQGSVGAACQPSVYTPFGGGPRLCPGYELARVSISVFLHHLVTQFSWTPAEEDKLLFFPTTRTQKRYPIHVERRNITVSV